LTTAYQISENIIIMYSGTIAEAGSVQNVIRSPKHPYTQLLISSIPSPSKHKSWGGGETEEAQTSTRQSAGCRFAPRCPKAMDICWTNKPALYMPDEERAVSCFLYQTSPKMKSPDVAQIFQQNNNRPA
jgi:peptide/nickel transport system ATP-binding protein